MRSCRAAGKTCSDWPRVRNWTRNLSSLIHLVDQKLSSLRPDALLSTMLSCCSNCVSGWPSGLYLCIKSRQSNDLSLLASSPWDNFRPGTWWGCDVPWVRGKNCKTLGWSRKGLSGSVWTASHLSSVLSNGMLSVGSAGAQVVKEALFNMSRVTVPLSSHLEHSYFRAFLFSLKYCFSVTHICTLLQAVIERTPDYLRRQPLPGAQVRFSSQSMLEKLFARNLKWYFLAFPFGFTVVFLLL